MIKCPKCNGRTNVLDSRGTANNVLRRRRKCLLCKHRFTTFEGIDAYDEIMEQCQNDIDEVSVALANIHTNLQILMKRKKSKYVPRSMRNLK